MNNFNSYTAYQWKEVVTNFCYACKHGDGDLLESLCEKYEDVLLTDDDDDDIEYYDLEDDTDYDD